MDDLRVERRYLFMAIIMMSLAGVISFLIINITGDEVTARDMGFSFGTIFGAILSVVYIYVTAKPID